MDKILITGASGQLGTELRYLFDEQNIEYEAPNVNELDISNRNTVDSYFKKVSPDYVFHCAAYTAVDQAEESVEENWSINAIGTENIAKASEQYRATLIYISTDYIFDGTKKEPYLVDDKTNPKSEYGKAKLAGEQAVQKYCNKYYIVRTSWVFGKYGNNFANTMLELAVVHDSLTIVADQFGRPTWTRTLAEFLYHLYINKPDYGVYHLSNEGSCSWYEFAKEILKDKDITLIPVSSEEYPQKASRPQYSIMSLEKVKKTGFDIISWNEALKLFKNSL